MLDFFRFNSLSKVRHAITTRHGGVSPTPFASLNLGLSTDDNPHNILANRRIALSAAGVMEETVLYARISHGREVSTFRADRPEEWPVRRVSRPDGGADAAFMTDAAVSDAPGLHFLLTFADCVPLAFHDTLTGAVGAAHAGWRGTALGVGPAVVRAMAVTFGTSPRDLVVGIGPSIGPCCYTVGTDVLRTFATEGSRAVIDDGGNLNLWASNRNQLIGAGVPADAIETAGICTRCNVVNYYSHRGEAGRTGRFAMIIGS